MKKKKKTASTYRDTFVRGHLGRIIGRPGGTQLAGQARGDSGEPGALISKRVAANKTSWTAGVRAIGPDNQIRMPSV